MSEGLCTKCSATQYCADHDPGASVEGARQDVVANVRELRKLIRHDVACHPSSGHHSEDCLRRRQLLDQIEAALAALTALLALYDRPAASLAPPEGARQDDWWAKLGELLKTGGMDDPAFIYGQVQALVEIASLAPPEGLRAEWTESEARAIESYKSHLRSLRRADPPTGEP
jgi:hypothetical protein